ncbi:MAG: CotH kinase family protein [Bacteroidota bacterium]
MMRQRENNHKLVQPILILLLATLFSPVQLTSQIRINEIMASNATVHADLDFGSYCDWIEIYNPTDLDIDVTGYYLSDDAANLTMWPFQSGTIIPAHQFLLVYADGTGDGLHTNFKLAKAGEPLMLVGPQSEIIDFITYPAQLTDISYGRSGANFQALGYFDAPTPGEMNGDQILNGISPSPVFSLNGGFYTGIQSVTLTTPGGATIYYTLDGTEPTNSSQQYTAPIALSQNTVLRAKTLEENLLPGLTITKTYFIDEPQNLPVISLVTDPDHFFSDETGIYVEGTGGIPGYCTTVPHNVNQDWERPVNIELFEKDGTIGLNQMAGVKIFGGCSRVRYPMKSLSLFARKEYETASFNYPLFPDKSSEEYETFILRASADDQPFTLFRDPLTQMLVKDVIDVDIQAYRPMVVYINGEYWGIHNMREKINEHYIEDNYGVNPDSVDLLMRNPEESWNVISGSADHYNAMMDYLSTNDITQKSHYDYMKSQMDMDEYISYQVIQIFFGGRDWPGNNIKYWRSREAPHKKWRWILYDLDHMFKEYFSDIMEEATEVDCGCVWPNPPWSTYLFRRLLENEEFKNEFTQRFAIYSTTHFSRERLHSFIDQLQAVLAPEIPRHIERWGGQKTNLPDNTWVSPIFNSVSEWEANVQVMRDFTDTRHELAMKHLSDYFGTSGYAALEASIEPAGAGHISIGATLVTGDSFSGEFPGGEMLSVEWKEGSGYLFSHWELDYYETKDTSLITQGDEWKYFISRETPDLNWTATEYDDNHWESGLAQLGYGDGDEQTVVDFGGDPGNKIVTTWFRKKFVIEDTSKYKRYSLNLLRDDGARVFVNGLVVIRDNMQRWAVGSNATAESVVDAPDESAWLHYTLNPALFRNGDNVIAVEIHQGAVTSSDISFDLQLVARSNQTGTLDTVYENGMVIELVDDTKLTAIVITDTSRIENVFINEILASNNAIHMDEMGEFEDWVELYNAGEEAVDLGGLFLADSLPALHPWQFPMDQPDVTTMPPNGFMVVYVDNDPEQGPLHADFKLGKAGEEVALLQKIGQDTLILDHVVFGTQIRNITYGRYPDGTPVFKYMTETTPVAPNIYWAVGIDPDPSASEDEMALSVYPVPTNDLLYVKLNESLSNRDLQVEVSVYSITGKKIYSSLHHPSQLISLSLGNQPAGLYLLRVSAGGQMFVKRVVVH